MINYPRVPVTLLTNSFLKIEETWSVRHVSLGAAICSGSWCNHVTSKLIELAGSIVQAVNLRIKSVSAGACRLGIASVEHAMELD